MSHTTVKQNKAEAAVRQEIIDALLRDSGARTTTRKVSPEVDIINGVLVKVGVGQDMTVEVYESTIEIQQSEGVRLFYFTFTSILSTRFFGAMKPIFL